MKTLKVAFIIVTIFKWLTLLFNTIMIYYFIKIFYLNNSDINYNFEFNGISILSDNKFTEICIILSIISSFLVFTSIHFFGKLLKNFNQKSFFDKDSVSLLNYIGHSLVLSFTFLLCSRTLFYINDTNSQTNLNFGYLILLVFALFFYVLSAVFKVAEKIKEENELTI